MPLRLAELQVLAELVRERRATTTELALVLQRTDVCSLTPDQASRLLRRLAKERKLKLRGERRGSEYVRPA